MARKKKKFVEGELTGKVVDAENGERFEMVLVPEKDAHDFRQDQDVSLAARLWAKIRPSYKHKTSDADDEKTTDVSTQGTMYGSSQVAEAYYDQLKMEEKRGAMYDDYKRMDKESTEAHRALNVSIANVFTSKEGDETTHKIKSEDTRVQSTLEDVDKRVEMSEFSPKWCRGTLKFGDSFVEPVADDKGLIVRLKWLNPKYVERNEDEFGRLDAERAFLMKDVSGTVYASFFYWQVIHTRYEHTPEERYGTSFFAVARRPWRQIGLMEDSIIIRRLTRAAKRYGYYLPIPKGTSRIEQERIVKQFKTDMRRTRLTDSEGNVNLRKKMPLEEEDVVIPVYEGSPAKVEMFDPGGMNDNMLDILYFKDKIIMGLAVPSAYMGADKEVRGRAHLGWQDIEFARTLRSTQKMQAGAQRSVYDLQLLFLGMKSVDKEQYTVEFPPISFVDERIKQEVESLKWTMAIQANSGLGVPTRWVLEKIVGLPEEDVEYIMANLEEPTAGGGKPATEPGAKSLQLAKEAVFGNMQLRDDISELRDKLQYIIMHKLNQPLVVHRSVQP